MVLLPGRLPDQGPVKYKSAFVLSSPPLADTAHPCLLVVFRSSAFYGTVPVIYTVHPHRRPPAQIAAAQTVLLQFLIVPILKSLLFPSTSSLVSPITSSNPRTVPNEALPSSPGPSDDNLCPRSPQDAQIPSTSQRPSPSSTVPSQRLARRHPKVFGWNFTTAGISSLRFPSILETPVDACECCSAFLPLAANHCYVPIHRIIGLSTTLPFWLTLQPPFGGFLFIPRHFPVAVESRSLTDGSHSWRCPVLIFSPPGSCK
jgi:hypothetical protein